MLAGQRVSGRPLAVGVALMAAAAGAVVAPAAPAQAAPTVLTVTTTADHAVDGACSDGAAGTSLREALCSATAVAEAVVELPAGTYALQAGALVVDPLHALDLTLRGAGATTTTIDARDVSRVLDVDPSLVGGVDLTVEAVTLTRGVGTSGTGGGGAIIAGSAGANADSLTLRDCAFTGNRNAPGSTGTQVDVGGAVSMTGGVLRVERCRFTANTSVGASGGAIGYTGAGGGDQVIVVDSVVADNVVDGTTTPLNVGGALDVAWGAPVTTITGTQFLRNLLQTGPRPAQGSAIRVATGVATLTGVSVAGNQATGATGSTAAVHLAAGTISDSRIVGNLTTVGTVTTRAGVVGATSAVRTWWGCTDLASATCDSAGGAATAPYATPALTLTPSTASVGGTVTATADMALSDDSAPTAALRGAMSAATMSWHAPGVTFTSPLPFSTSGPATNTFTASGATTVTVTVDGVDASAALSVPVAPAVTDDPDDQEVLEGADATFTAAASGAPAPTVAWERRAGTSSPWESIPGATSAELVLPDVARTDDGAQVRAVFTNASGTATSAAATLQVSYGPVDVTSPADVSGLAGAEVTFTASADGRPAPTVRWQTSPDGTSWTDVTDETAWTYTRTLTASDDGLRVRAVASGAAGDVETTPAQVTLLSAPVITTQPVGVVTDPGLDAVFTVAGTGVPTPSVTWYLRAPGGDWQATAVTASTITLPSVSAGLDGYELRAVLTNAHGSATSDTATLHVFHGPAITGQPSSVTGVAGDEVSFTVEADGWPEPGVQWQTSADGVGWVPVPGATAWTYTRELSDADDGLWVRAAVTGAEGTVESDAAGVSLEAAPTITTDPADQVVDLGTSATFEVAATGRPAPTVIWQVDADGDGAGSWATVPGETGTTLVVPGTAGAHGARFRAVVTNTHGTATSTAASLSVLLPPTVSDPQDALVAPGRAATFTVVATGRPAPTVTWESSTDGVTWAPAGSGPELTLTPTLADDGTLVRAIATATLVSGPVSATSEPAELVVAAPPEILDGPGQATTVTAGTPVSLTWTVQAAGATTRWDVSRDGGVTWSPVPAGWVVDARVAGAQEIGGPAGGTHTAAVHTAAVPVTGAQPTGALGSFSVAEAAGPAVRTVHSLTLTPTAADDGAQVRLRVTTAGGSVTAGTSLDVVPAPAAPDGGRPGSGSPLPRTGADPMGLMALSALLAVAGLAGMLVTSRLRRRHA